MENEKLEVENFDLALIDDLPTSKAKAYIDKYFIPLTDGKHAFLIDGEYQLYDKAIIKSTYFDRMPAELSKYYFKEKKDLRSITYNINKPILYDKKLNLCPKIMHSYDKKYDEFSEETKSQVDIILQHIKEVYCNNRIDAYEYFLNWLANALRGNRNKSAIYLKGPQGIGKSSIVDDFLRKYVVGEKLYYQGGSGPLKEKFNGGLSGKLFVLFEELENFSVAQWFSVSCVLKRNITSDTLQIERKGQDMREEPNLNNYILNSNNNAIQDEDGRRYFICDIITKYLGNVEYFKKLHNCFNMETGHAFYCLMYERDLTEYSSLIIPITQSKLDAFAKRLDDAYKFIKDQYILKRKALEKVKPKDLYTEYCSFCSELDMKPKDKQDFNKQMENVGITRRKSNGYEIYDHSLDALKAVADKFHWIHELDEEEEEDNTKSPSFSYEVDDKDVDIQNLKNQIYQMQKRINDLEKENAELKVAKKVSTKKKTIPEPSTLCASSKASEPVPEPSTLRASSKASEPIPESITPERTSKTSKTTAIVEQEDIKSILDCFLDDM